jgi:hypothetical protein
MKKVSCVGLLFVFVLFLAATSVLAQSDLGTISGFVKDPSGAFVPDAKVTISNQSGIERVVTTNESGYYNITNIPAGFYSITVEASGFQRYSSTDNKLDPQRPPEHRHSAGGWFLHPNRAGRR